MVGFVTRYVGYDTTQKTGHQVHAGAANGLEKGRVMSAALNQWIPSDAATPAREQPRQAACPMRQAVDYTDWRKELPPEWADQAVPPLLFEVHQEYEVLADRVDGRDPRNQFCYFAYRYVLTQLRDDDDEGLYEAPVYIETLTAWRLKDGRWLHLHQTVSDCERGTAHRELFVNNERPR